MLNEVNVLFFSLLGGIVPALFWILFWLREDRLRPEPRTALFSSFLGGILAVAFALFFELVIYYLVADAKQSITHKTPAIFWNFLKEIADNFNLLAWQSDFWPQVQDWFNNLSYSVTYNIEAKRFFLIVLLAPFVEELFKLIFAWQICLKRKINDEPVDASIYMITTALGFAAVETALFLTQPLAKGHFFDTFIASNFRSIGPMLIHIVCSAIIGLCIGLAFYKGKISKFFFAILGFLIAFFLHAGFNFFIVLQESSHNLNFFWVAVAETWALVIFLLFFFEKVKKIARKR